MDELFDSLEECNFSRGIHHLNNDQQRTDPNVSNSQQIIDQLCQITDEETNQLRQEIDSLDDGCCDLNETRYDREIQNWSSQNDNVFKLDNPPNIDDILSMDEASIPPTSHNVGVINNACQQVLREIEQQLLSLLKKNRKEQEIVLDFLTTNGKSKNFETSKKVSVKCIGIPYFKDLDGYPPPPNEDVLSKKKNKKLLPTDFLDFSTVWNNYDAKNLVNAVNNVMKVNSNPAPNIDAIDWMKISATDMDGKYSPNECKSKWLLNLNPSVNRSKWGIKEIKSLNVIAEKFNFQDWKKIADELGTNRTDFQCCVQYHTQNSTRGGKWTKEEDEELKQLIKKYKVKDYIPWIKVTWHFGKRSLRQCEERYAYHLGNIKKGGFTMTEDFVLVYLATKLKNFGEVAKYLPKRVSPQIRARYEYLVKLSMPKFTKEEDELLTQLMIKYPRNWNKISEHFQIRSKLQCRGRWSAIQKDIKLGNDVTIDNDLEEDQNIINAETVQISTNKKNVEIMDADSVKKNLQLLPRFEKSAKQNNKKLTENYISLLDHHKYCHKFLFGPRPRITSNPEDWSKLCRKMRVTMKTLSLNSTSLLRDFSMNSLSNNCDFDEEDINVLTQLTSTSREENPVVEISNKLIPPNYITLVGLRTYTLGWSRIINLSRALKIPPQSRSSENVSADRLLFTDAKKLFKARVKAIFALPLILSNISQETKPAYKPKVRKQVKSLSKRKRKEHAKLMSQAYRNQQKLLKGKFEDCDESESFNDDFSASPNGNKRKKGKDSSSKLVNSNEDVYSSESSIVEESNGAKRRRRGRPRKTECQLQNS